MPRAVASEMTCEPVSTAVSNWLRAPNPAATAGGHDDDKHRSVRTAKLRLFEVLDDLDHLSIARRCAWRLTAWLWVDSGGRRGTFVVWRIPAHEAPEHRG